MKRTITKLVLLLASSVLLVAPVEARRCYGGCGRGSSAVGFFAGALAGAAIAGAYDGYPPYYYTYGPRPLYAYDYPAFAYSPLYAYPNTVYAYPGFYSPY